MAGIIKSAEAHLALLSGQNEKALALLHNDSSPGAALARIRAFFRLRRFQRAIELAEAVDPEFVAYEEAVAVKGLHIFLLARIGDVKAARSMMAAFAEFIKPNDHLAMLEFTYISGYLEYCSGDLSLCVSILSKILDATDRVAEDRRRYSFQQDAYVMRAKAATLLGVIFTSRGMFAEMEKAHCDALLSAEQANPRDKFFEALILANLSCLVGQSYSASAIHLLQSRVSSFDWNAGLEEHRVYIKRHLRIAAVAFSPNLNLAAIGGRSSPSLAYRLAECVDALLLKTWCSMEEYLGELTFSKQFVDRVDWQTTDGEEFTSLDDLIPVLVPFDRSAADEAQRRFQEKLSALLPHFTNSYATFDQASRHFSRACMAKARSEWDSAALEFKSAISIWTQSNVLWRAAIAATELYTILKDHELLEIPRKFIAMFPNTPLSARLSRAVLAAEQGTDKGAFPYLKEAITG